MYDAGCELKPFFPQKNQPWFYDCVQLLKFPWKSHKIPYFPSLGCVWYHMFLTEKDHSWKSQNEHDSSIQITNYATQALQFFLLNFFVECSLTGVPVPCNIMWAYAQCLTWRSWMQTLDWFLVIRIPYLFLAMFHADFLHCTKKLQVWLNSIDVKRLALWRIWCTLLTACRYCTKRSGHHNSCIPFSKWRYVNLGSGIAMIVKFSIIKTKFLMVISQLWPLLHGCVQRVMEDRVPNLLEKLLVKPSLVNSPPMEDGGLLLVS